MEEAHFWFVGRCRLVLGLVAGALVDQPGALLVDCGCGTGHTQRALRALGLRAVGVDLRPEHLLDPGTQAQADTTALPLRSGAADGVLALDVLEHIIDDRAALAELTRVLRPGGLAVFTVPAHPWLWSHRDDDDGHVRRYRRRELVAAVADAGLVVDIVSSYQAVLLPLVVASRLVGRRGKRTRDLEDRPSAPINWLLGTVNRLEVAAFERGISAPWGSSLVLTAHRPP